MKILLTASFVAASCVLSASAAPLRWGKIPLYVGNFLPSGVNLDNERYAKAVADGAEGTVLVWAAADPFEGSEFRLYAQRVTPDGRGAWNRGDALQIAHVPGKDIGNLGVARDASGGFVVFYEALRKGSFEGPLHALRLNADGAVDWRSSGALMSRADEFVLVPASDGSLVALVEAREGKRSVLSALRLDARGKVAYRRELYSAPLGTSLHSAPFGQAGAAPGEALFILSDRRERADGYGRLYSLHLSADGRPTQTRIASAPAGLDVSGPCLRLMSATADRDGGAFVAWTRPDTGELRLSRVARDGRLAAGWDENGRLVDADPKSDKFNLFVAPDGADGALVQYASREREAASCGDSGSVGSYKSWCDSGKTRCHAGRSSEIWLARVTKDAAKPAFYSRVSPRATLDGHQTLAVGGAFYSSWVDADTQDVLVQRFDAKGASLLGDRGVTAGSYKGAGSLGITMMPSKDGGVLVAWKQSERLYAQSVGAR